MALNELYYNLSVFVYPACPVGPADGTGVTLWLNYYQKSSTRSQELVKENLLHKPIDYPGYESRSHKPYSNAEILLIDMPHYE